MTDQYEKFTCRWCRKEYELPSFIEDLCSVECFDAWQKKWNDIASAAEWTKGSVKRLAQKIDKELIDRKLWKLSSDPEECFKLLENIIREFVNDLRETEQD